MEIVLHECGETRWTDLVTDIFEQNTVLPGNGTEKRTRGLFDDEGTKGSDGIADSERVGEAGKGRSIWDDIEWRTGTVDDGYVTSIHPFRLNKFTRKWRSDRAR